MPEQTTPQIRLASGTVILIVPPTFHIPGGDFVAPNGTLIGVKDATTGDLFPGVLSMKLKASADRNDPDITVKLREIAIPDPDEPGMGRPARTVEDVQRAVTTHGATNDPPWVVNRYLVAGFEIGPTPEVYFDAGQFMRDVGDVKRALGIGDEDGNDG